MWISLRIVFQTSMLTYCFTVLFFNAHGGSLKVTIEIESLMYEPKNAQAVILSTFLILLNQFTDQASLRES